MVDLKPQMEVSDTCGSKSKFDGALTASFVAYPSSAGKVIGSFILADPISQDPGKIIDVSFDGGVTIFKSITTGDTWIWSPNGEKKQIHLKSAQLSTFSLVINFEDFYI